MMYAKLFIQEKFWINNTGTALIKKKNLLLTGWNRPLFYKSKLLQRKNPGIHKTRRKGGSRLFASILHNISTH